jgi:hypothetical protein
MSRMSLTTPAQHPQSALCLGSEGASTASDKARFVNSPGRTPLMLPIV